MYFLVFIIGIVLILVGILFIKKGLSLKKFYGDLEDGKKSDYKKIIGTVICNAYSIDDATEVLKSVTPIVEYEVNGQKYETQNRVLETGAELPVGTKIYLWYKKDNPKQAILGLELNSVYFERRMGSFLIVIGIIFVMMCI